MLVFRILAMMLILGTLGLPYTSYGSEENQMLTLEKQLIRDEGMRLDVYRDHLGKPTVGVGHLVLPSDKLKVGDKISNSRALQMFRKDIKTSQRDAAIFVGADKFKTLSEPMKNVVTNMAFQMGATKLAKFKKLKAAIKNDDYKAMAKEMKESKWYKQTPNRADRLISVVQDEGFVNKLKKNANSLEENSGKVFVEGYTRSDGVKIPSHFRKMLNKVFGA